jgi:hypothetical protein
MAPAVPMIDYAVNYKYISEELCVNKDKPEMHCNGKCHLKKEIKKVLGDENPAKNKTTLPGLKLKDYTFYQRNNLINKFFIKYNYQQTDSIYIVLNTFRGYLSEQTKPPQAYFLPV